MYGTIQIYEALPPVSGFFITAKAHIEAKYNQSIGENVPSHHHVVSPEPASSPIIQQRMGE